MIKTLLPSTEVAGENWSDPECVCVCTYLQRVCVCVCGIAATGGRGRALDLPLTSSTVANAKASRKDTRSACHTWRADSQQCSCLSACILCVRVRGFVYAHTHTHTRMSTCVFHHGHVSNGACFKETTNPQK